MSKVISKQELSQLVLRADALEITYETIKRTSSQSSKSAQGSSFNKQVQEFLKEQRDVILIAVKLR